MKATTPNISQGTASGAILSMDTVFVLHYMGALENLQKTWIECEHVVDAGKFFLQVEYLVRLIPDREIQKKIENERSELFGQFKKDGLDHPDIRAGMIVITHLVEFICNSFDLLHLDITGAATIKQYRDAVLEIPDMPEETAKAGVAFDGE